MALILNKVILPVAQILKKSLGQHFLKDENVCTKIVSVLNEHTFNQLLEVGAGGGALTKYLLQISGIDFRTVEIDADKVQYLKKAYPAIIEKIIHKDILDIEIPFSIGEFTIIGNFPYNISSQIIFKILEWKNNVPVMIGMFQKEVAMRIVAQPSNKIYGILSVLVQAFYKVEYLFEVMPESFTPPPKVMSAVIKLEKRNILPNMQSEKAYFTLVKTAFNQRRKMLRNAVKGLFDEAILKKDIFNKRAEQLSVADFAALTFEMNK